VLSEQAPAVARGRPRRIRVIFAKEWAAPELQGLLAGDARLRTLRRVLVTYPDVRHILPDQISLEPTVDDRVLDAVAHFLQRQQWLVKSVILE
jgi:hypothetical protein